MINYVLFFRLHSTGTDRWHSLRVCKYCMRGSPRVIFGSLEVLPVYVPTECFKPKIIDAKTEFIVFRSPMLIHDLTDLSVNVGGNLIKPSEKVRDLGVILDQTLSVCSLSYQEYWQDQKFIIIRWLCDPNSCVNWLPFRLLQLAALQHCTCKDSAKDCKKCRIKQCAFSQGRLAETTLLPCLSSYTG